MENKKKLSIAFEEFDQEKLNQKIFKFAPVALDNNSCVTNCNCNCNCGGSNCNCNCGGSNCNCNCN